VANNATSRQFCAVGGLGSKYMIFSQNEGNMALIGVAAPIFSHLGGLRRPSHAKSKHLKESKTYRSTSI
jgi:hypothetical protein